MSGANITCANCRKVFWHDDDAAQAQAFLSHNCAETKRSQTVTNYSSVSDNEWSAITARLNHPSNYTPDGAA
jgi:hypothetical protein